jgi:hypothetical protein
MPNTLCHKKRKTTENAEKRRETGHPDQAPHRLELSLDEKPGICNKHAQVFPPGLNVVQVNEIVQPADSLHHMKWVSRCQNMVRACNDE